VSCSHDTGSLQNRYHSGQPLLLSDNAERGGHFQYFTFFRTHVRNGLHDFPKLTKGSTSTLEKDQFLYLLPQKKFPAFPAIHSSHIRPKGSQRICTQQQQTVTEATTVQGYTDFMNEAQQIIGKNVCVIS
jgi:hypothetical protein